MKQYYCVTAGNVYVLISHTTQEGAEKLFKKYFGDVLLSVEKTKPKGAMLVGSIVNVRPKQPKRKVSK